MVGVVCPLPQAGKISQLVHPEQQQRRVLSHEVLAHGWAKCIVKKAQQTGAPELPDALVGLQDGGVAIEPALQYVQVSQGRFCFLQVVGVAVHSRVYERIVNVEDGDALFLQRLAEQHVLITVLRQCFVEVHLQEYVLVNHDVERGETFIGMPVAVVGRVLPVYGHFVAEAERVVLSGILGRHRCAAANDLGACGVFQVVLYEMVVDYGRVAVHDEYKRIAHLPNHGTANARAAHVAACFHQMAMAQGVDPSVNGQAGFVG